MMNDILDGTSPAFPCDWICADSMGQQVVREQYSGITIRDYFAAKALQGLLACQSLGYLYTGKDAELKAASEAYRYANAMIAAREEKP